MNVFQLIAQEYRVKTTYNINPNVSQVAITVTQVLPLNPRRAAFTLVNLGNNYITIAMDNTVSLTKGIYLVPNGGFVHYNWKDDLELPTLDFYAIADTAPSDIFLHETLLEYDPTD